MSSPDLNADDRHEAVAEPMLAVVPRQLHRASLQSAALRLDPTALSAHRAGARGALCARTERGDHGRRYRGVSSRPKNTLSRAVNSLLRKKLLLRKQDQADRRRLSLYLTRSGRRIFNETVPHLVAREQAMAAALTASEQHVLNRLLTKIILSKSQWPATVGKETIP